MQAIDRGAADSLIGWWLDAGVDGAVSETPRDWLGEQKPRRETVPATTSPAEKPADLAAFQAWLATAPGLPMDRPGAIRVSPHGPECAKIMLLPDLPAREDAAQGKPIGGEAWALTCRMLAAIGLNADESYVASLSPFHAPGARFNGDLDSCATIARDHVRLARPERLILFGDASAKGLIGEPLARARGKVHRVEGVRTIATFHPRWLLQRPSDKALAWRDLLLLMSEGD
jgi:uracil-DNA glycosylase family 4